MGYHLWRYSTLLSLYIFLTVVVASDSGNHGLLTFKGLNDDSSSLQGNTSEGADVNSLFGTLEKRTPSLFGRQYTCRAGRPLKCPDGIHCTTPSMSVCCPDGVHSCATGGRCCNQGSHCTPPGGSCCHNTACYAGQVCCPGGCGPSGSKCCGSDHACPPGSPCCSGNGCADVGNICCGPKSQCEATEQCCPGSYGCAPKTATCCGPKTYCMAGTTCCTDSDGDHFCSPGKTCIDSTILDLKDYPGLDEIFENMCRGMRQSAAYNQAFPDEIILSYIGKNKKSHANKNRRLAGCGDSPCAKLFGYYVNGKKVRWSCDEFPFATSHEGGSDASILCVPQSDNSVLGNRWGQAVKNKSPGTKIRIKFRGIDCSKVPMGKRDIGAGGFNPDVVLERAASGAVMGNSTNGIFVNGSVYGNSSDGKVAMIIPLDIPVDFEGSYTVNYTVASGSIKSGFITDDWGEEYGALDISSSAKSSSNTIDIGPDGIGNAMIMAWVDDTEVKLDYTTTSTALTDITTSTPTPTIVPDTTDTESPSSDPSFTEPPPSIGARQESGLLLVLAAPIAVLLLA